jgi:hypothetical protein
VHVSVNNFGLVINFMQATGLNNQPVMVSRLGMSREHALSVVAVITEAVKKSVEAEKAAQGVKRAPLGLGDGSSERPD